jgi:hypothetical protein
MLNPLEHHWAGEKDRMHPAGISFIGFSEFDGAGQL